MDGALPGEDEASQNDHGHVDGGDDGVQLQYDDDLLDSSNEYVSNFRWS